MRLLLTVIASAIRQVGGPVTVNEGKTSVTFTASLQPDLTRERSLAGPAGRDGGLRYQLYASCGEHSPLLKRGNKITQDGALFLIERADVFYVRGRPLYHQARLLRLEEDEHANIAPATHTN